LPGAKLCGERIIKNFNLEKMKNDLMNIIEQYRPARQSNLILPGQSHGFDIPKLKKIGNL